jgi:hypothetical protein
MGVIAILLLLIQNNAFLDKVKMCRMGEEKLRALPM